MPDATVTPSALLEKLDRLEAAACGLWAVATLGALPNGGAASGLWALRDELERLLRVLQVGEEVLP